MKPNTLKPAQIADRMRIAVTPRRLSNWLTGLRSPNVVEMASLLEALPDEDARALIDDMAARYRAKH